MRSPLVSLALLLALWPGLVSTAGAQVLHDPRLAHDTLFEGPGMVALAFAPDGRLYVCQKRGLVLTFAPDGKGGYAAPTVFLDLTAEVTAELESGLLGLALDPAFATNRHVFLYFTREDGPRLLRVTASTSLDTVEPGSELPLLSHLPHATTYHKAGQLSFAPGEAHALYVGLGDDGNPGATQDVDRYEGKILRVNKADGRGLPDNPFCNGELDAARCRVWAHGLRNPFRFVFHPSGRPADTVYLAENGNVTDRLSRVSRGSNGAWSTDGDSGGFLAPPDQGHRVLSTQNGSLTALRIAAGGSFAQGPGESTLLVANGAAGTIQRYRMAGAALERLEPLDQGLSFLSGLPLMGAVDMALGPDGALYYVNSAIDASDAEQHLLGRVRVLDGGPLPSATTALAQQAVVAPGAAPSTRSSDRGCDDLSSIPPHPEVAYEHHIQPIWTTQCAGCHDGTGRIGGGLDLREGSRERLVAISSTYVPGLLRVLPGSPEGSYLFEKINCAHPRHGLRMRPGAALSLQKQALIRDWIEQLTDLPRRPPFGMGPRRAAAAALGLTLLALALVWWWRRWRARL